MNETKESIFQSDLPLKEKLERARTELLDLSARNRLLNVPRFSRSAKTIDVVNERTSEVYRLLVNEGKTFAFAAGKPDRVKSDREAANAPDDNDDYSPIALPQPDDEQDLARRHSDTNLQTRMTPTGLQRRLLDLYYDARTLEEEQGVNILFLALGMLKWIDPNNKENVRHAPLILVPVRLERSTAGERFHLKSRPEDQTGNLSLEAYLNRAHGLALPPFEVGEDFEPVRYLASVADAISTKDGWEVLPDDMTLGFFSFAKFLMYRDLDPENWPEGSKITDQPKIRSLLADGFEAREPLMSDDIAIDPHIAPADMIHIVDSDSSQTLAIHDVRRGRDLVIQGPPGTGKSQTIANIIASAVADGKTVLFVAEKMAALEVVKRRLDHAGVGDACLELHSNKANKRMLLEELRRTWQLGSPRGQFPSSLASRVLEARDKLNAHSIRMHATNHPSGLTPYLVLGHLTRLRQQGQRPVDIQLSGSTEWTAEGVATRRRLLEEVSQRIDEMGLPFRHPWRGISLEIVLPTTIERLAPRVDALASRTRELRSKITQIATDVELDAPSTLNGVGPLLARAQVLAAAPSFQPSALMASIWDTHQKEIYSLLKTGTEFSCMSLELSGQLLAGAMAHSVTELKDGLAGLPTEFAKEGFVRAHQLTILLSQLKEEAERLNSELGRSTLPDTLAGLSRLATIGERIAAAPHASLEAFASTLWESDLEQASDLAENVAALESARSTLHGKVADAAWATDVAAARQALATHTGILKSLNGDYRRAKALTRSILTDPHTTGTELLHLLDTLVKGQAAAERIREADSFGRSAFGADWRGVRSASAPLLALVEWMRSVRGLGPEPRQIAGRLTERSEAAARAARLRKVLELGRPIIEGFWNDLGDMASALLDGVASLDRVRLDLLEAKARAVHRADEISRHIFVSSPDAVADRLQLARRLEHLQQLAGIIDAGADIADAAFGSDWGGRNSDWPVLADGELWIRENGVLRHLAARLPKRLEVLTTAEFIRDEAGMVADALTALAGDLKGDAPSLFGASNFLDGTRPVTAAFSGVRRREK